jgi:hypothetical protein
VDDPVVHHEIDPSSGSDVVERIAGHGDDVRG